MPGTHATDTRQTGKPNYPLGIISMILAGFFLALIGVCAKLLADEGGRLNAGVISFYQFFISLLVMVPFVFRKKLTYVKTKHPYLMLTRALAGVIFMVFLTISLKYIVLVDGMVLCNSSPLFVPFIIWLWFHKKLHTGLVMASCIGFLGIVFILHPGTQAFFNIGSLFALGSGILGALGIVAIRKLIGYDKGETISFYFFLVGTLLLIPITSLFYQWQLPVGKEWWPILGMGIFLPAMQVFLTKATYYAPATRVAPFLYLSIVFSGIFGWIIWHEVPTWQSYAGTLLVVVGAILAIIVGDPPQVPQGRRTPK